MKIIHEIQSRQSRRRAERDGRCEKMVFRGGGGASRGSEDSHGLVKKKKGGTWRGGRQQAAKTRKKKKNANGVVRVRGVSGDAWAWQDDKRWPIYRL